MKAETISWTQLDRAGAYWTSPPVLHLTADFAVGDCDGQYDFVAFAMADRVRYQLANDRQKVVESDRRELVTQALTEQVASATSGALD